MTTLKERRARGDIIQYFKIYRGFNKLNWYNGNRLMVTGRGDGPAMGVRGNQHRLAKQLTNVEARRNFISNRVVSRWNKLSPSMISSNTINSFKKQYDFQSRELF